VVVEHVNAFQKKHQQTRGTMRKRNLEKCMAIAIATNVVGNVHKHKQVEATVPLLRKSVQLGKNAFGKVKIKASIPLKGIASKERKACWAFAPAPENQGLPVADSFLLRALDKNPNLNLSHACLGVFAKASYRIAIRRPERAGVVDAIPWILCLFSFKDSCIAGWPVDIRPVPNHPGACYAEFDKAIVDPQLFAVCGWADLVAMHFRWRSPAWQHLHLQNAKWPDAIRLIADTGEMPMASLCCVFGWFRFNTTELKATAKALGNAVADESGLFDTLKAMNAKAKPEATAEQCLQYMAHRFEEEPKEAELSGVLLEVDAAMNCLERSDEEKLRKEKAAAKDKCLEYEEFVKQWINERCLVRDRALGPPPAKGKGKAKGKAKGKGAVGPPPPPKRSLPPAMDNMMDQKDAKGWMPPPEDAKLWKSRRPPAWHTEVPPFSSCNRSVGLHGENALRAVISDAWRKWCWSKGISLEECPMTDLVVDDGAVEAARPEGVAEEA